MYETMNKLLSDKDYYNSSPHNLEIKLIEKRVKNEIFEE